MRILARLIAVFCLIGLAGSLAGAWHPAGDSLAVFRPALAVALLLTAPVLRGRAGLAASAVALVALAPILWDLWRPVQGPANGIVVYQKNLRFDLADPAPIIADIRASGAGIVFLEEVSWRNLAVSERLKAGLPYQLICPGDTTGAIAILSRWPLDRRDCVPKSGLASARARTPMGAVSVAVLHLTWPWPYGQAAQLDTLMPKIRGIAQPALVGGDFNMVPWSRAVRAIASATGTAPLGPLRTTFMLKGIYPMAIDHVLIPRGWAGRGGTRPLLGSDHRGVLTRIGP